MTIPLRVPTTLFLHHLSIGEYQSTGELSAEQHLQLEVHDFHDHPKFTVRWRYGVAHPMKWETAFSSGLKRGVNTFRFGLRNLKPVYVKSHHDGGH